MNLCCYSILFLVLLLSGCNAPAPLPDEQAERAQILELHNAQRDYHFNANAEAFVDQFSANYRSINRGGIQHLSQEQSLAIFQPYFESVDFIAWDDAQAPIIEFSDDYSMAYCLVDKEVIVAYPLDDGGQYIDTTQYAWTTIYRKYGGEWKVDCVTSTTVPKDY